MNRKLELGRYFFSDILREGVVLFTEPGVTFVKPQPLSAATAFIEVDEYYIEWMENADQRRRMSELALRERFNKVAAFELHQAVEALYIGLLPVLTLHSPRRTIWSI